jgi:hypothetical protein
MKAMAMVMAAACAAGCASGGSAAPKPALELVGSRIIGCCCASPCPCRINRKPLYCHGCDHADAVHIDRGHAGDVDLSGLTWVVVGRGFGEKPSENWVYVYVADTATDAQFKALGDMLTAEVKSWGAKAEHLAGKFVGMRKAPITYSVSADKREYRCTVGKVVELHGRAIVNPGRTEPVTSTGIMDAFTDRFVHVTNLKNVLKDPETGREWDLSGRQMNWAEFHVTPESKARGGGWGCWTAHSSYGDQEKYVEQMAEHK